MGVEWFRSVDDEGREFLVELFEESFRETSTDVADRFVILRVGIVGCQEEGTVYGGTFTTAKVGTQNHQVQGIADSSQVIFLDLSEDVSEIRRVSVQHEIKYL